MGHMQGMSGDKLKERPRKTEEGARRRGERPKLRWRDCVKRDLDMATVSRRERERIAGENSGRE